jgi:3-methyladenine DNA glycosylase AlkD
VFLIADLQSQAFGFNNLLPYFQTLKLKSRPMTVNEIMAELEAKGSESIKKILLKHGVKEPFFGVKVEYLKIIEKQIKKDYSLALDLYATGNADAMYLAGLLADDAQMTPDDLTLWAQQAISTNIASYTVPWVAAGSNHGFALAQNWIEDKEEHVAVVGWSTLGGLVSLKPDAELDLPALSVLLNRVSSSIQKARNQEKQAMNGFLIAVGSYVAPLSQEAIALAQQIGTLTVDTNGTACKVPSAADYIQKAIAKGSLTKKKKKLKC